MTEDPLQDAFTAFREGDYDIALRRFRSLAEQGVAGAQYFLGTTYTHTIEELGITQNFAEGLKWLRLAANQGYVLAQYKLGGIYHRGEGVPQDYFEAMNWYRLAADQNNADAQYDLGLIYAEGVVVPQDYVEAAKWFSLAAGQGDVRAQLILGVMHRNGEGVPKNHAEAAKWFGLAADQGDARAQYNLGGMHSKGEGMPQNFSEAAKWFRLAADQGDADAQHNLALKYGNGDGLPQDYVLAHTWFNLSAAQGNRHAITGRDMVAKLMTPVQIAEAQKLAREWKPTTQPTAAPEKPKMTRVDFIGSFMLLQFYDGHHWQMSDEALNRYAVSAGPELGQLMRFWTLMYLAWLFRWCILGVHGAEFEKAMMASFYERMKLAPVKPGEFDIAAAIKYWFEHLDLAATAATEKRAIGEHADLQLPNTYYAALRFIAFDPGSLWYMRDDAPGDLQDKVIFGLSKVHDEMLPHIQNFAQKIEVP